MQDLDIFICAHEDFIEDFCPKSPEYKIISANQLNGEYPVEIIYEKDDDWLIYNKIINEFTYLIYAYEHLELKKYVGFCHYRRYFTFYDNIPDMDKIFSEYDVIACPPYNSDDSMVNEFGTKHNIDDINFVDNFIADKDILQKWKEFKQTPTKHCFHQFNMFIMKSEDFKKYMEFIIPIIKGMLDGRGIHNFEDSCEYVKKNFENYRVCDNTEQWVLYQARCIGFVCERLTAFYIWANFKNPYELGVNMGILYLDQKYKKLKEYYELLAEAAKYQ